MPEEKPALLDRYLQHRRFWEVTMWVVALPLGAAMNSIVAQMGLDRRNLHFASW